MSAARSEANVTVYEAVLFDMDGVVADTAVSVAHFWRELAADRGRSLSEDDLDPHVFGRCAPHTLSALLPDLDGAEREEVHASLERYEAALSYREIPGAVRLVRELAALGMPCALVTSANSWKVEEVASQLGLRDSFATRVIADDVVRGKPDPEVYLLAAR